MKNKKSLRMQITLACLGSVIFVSVNGCSSVNPRISPIDRTAENANSKLEDAKKQIILVESNLQNKLRDQQDIGSISRLGVIGGTLGAGAAAIYRAHRDTIIGLGLLGAASYAIGTLYSPSVYADIYEAGLAALHCLDSFVSPAAAMLPIIRSDQENLDKAIERLAQLSQSGDAAAALTSARTASKRATSYLVREGLLASNAILAVNEVILITNKQVRENTPNLDAFSSIGRSVFAAAGNISGIAPPPVNGDTKLRAAAPKEDLDQSIKAVREAEQKLTLTLDSFDRLGDLQTSNCIGKASIDAAKPLSVTTADVPIKNNSSFVVSVSGGRQPYVGFWSGLRPSSDVLIGAPAPFSSSDFEFTAKKSFKGTNYKYVIKDASGSAREITVRSAD